MNDDRRTKAQILAELERVELQLAATRQLLPSAPSPVPAANALAGCIRALDAIPGVRSSNSYDRETRPNVAEIRHVVQHLLARYGIDLTVRTVEPCARPHVDEVSDDVLIDRLRGRF